jgi:parvulin-like peptidyl-prolyl isomerase
MSDIAMALENKVYAVVNGSEIKSQDIAMILKDPKINFDTLPKDTQQNILDKIIEQKLLSQNALNTGIVKDKIYIETLKSLKENLALQVWMQQKSQKIKISDSELKSFFDKNKQLFKVDVQLKAKHILLKTEDEAKDIIKTLNKSKNLKSKFIKLAKEKSIGPSGSSGGELGWFALDKMVPEFSTEANKLKVGTITQVPTKTQFGYHIIYLEDRKKASTMKFNDVKDQISQQLSQERFIEDVQKIADKLKKTAKIEYK